MEHPLARGGPGVVRLGYTPSCPECGPRWVGQVVSTRATRWARHGTPSPGDPTDSSGREGKDHRESTQRKDQQRDSKGDRRRLQRGTRADEAVLTEGIKALSRGRAQTRPGLSMSNSSHSVGEGTANPYFGIPLELDYRAGWVPRGRLGHVASTVARAPVVYQNM